METPPRQSDGFTSVAETARRWGISPQRVYKLLHTGRVSRNDYRDRRGMLVIRATLPQPAKMASCKKSRLLTAKSGKR